MKLSIIIPVFNEVNTIEKIINKIHIQSIKNFEIIVVDDCSTDGTREILKSKIRAKVKKIIYHKKNRGKGSAIITAKNYIKGDIVIIQDADLEYDPKDYKKLIFPILKKKTRVVYGTRVKKNKRYNSKNFISLSRIFFNHVLTIFSNILNNQNLTDAHTCYKTFESKLFKKIKLEEEDFAFCPEVTSKISKLNEKILEVPINYKGRSKAQGKKIGLIDGFRAIYVIIKYRLKT
tara:strand:+ start:2966 stop:3664 length:699 start_codon:yes stop_codon:yes gene_type:complete